MLSPVAIILVFLFSLFMFGILWLVYRLLNRPAAPGSECHAEPENPIINKAGI